MKRGKSTVRCGIRPMSGQTMLRALYILMIVALCLFALGTRKCGKTVLGELSWLCITELPTKLLDSTNQSRWV